MREIELCLNTNNDRAMKLYKKVGFEEKACLQHYIIGKKPIHMKMIFHMNGFYSFTFSAFITDLEVI